MEVKVAEGKVTQGGRDLLQRGDLFNKEQLVAAEIIAANADLKIAQQNAQAARDKLAQLEEELRRSGGPAGWAR
jgi:hypothetical protein